MKPLVLNTRTANRVRIAAWSLAALLVLSPLLATSVTDQVAWGVFDFIFAALLIGGLGVGWEIILKATRHRLWRAVLALALLGSVLLIWAELAVGIIH